MCLNDVPGPSWPLRWPEEDWRGLGWWGMAEACHVQQIRGLLAKVMGRAEGRGQAYLEKKGGPEA